MCLAGSGTCAHAHCNFCAADYGARGVLRMRGRRLVGERGGFYFAPVWVPSRWGGVSAQLSQVVGMVG